MGILVVFLRWMLDLALRRPKIPKECRGGWRRTYVDMPEREPDSAIPAARVVAIRGALGWAPLPAASWPSTRLCWHDPLHPCRCSTGVVMLAEGSQPVSMPVPGDGAPRS